MDVALGLLDSAVLMPLNSAHQLIYDGPCAGARPQLLLPGVALGTQLAQEAP